MPPDDPAAIRAGLEELHARWRDGGLPDVELSTEWRERLSRRTRVEEMAAVLRATSRVIEDALARCSLGLAGRARVGSSFSFCVRRHARRAGVALPGRFADANHEARANARLDYVDRELGGGNSVLPAQAIAIEARGHIPERDILHGRGRRAAGGLERARHSRHARQLHAVLPPASRTTERRSAVDPLLRLRSERVPGRAARLGRFDNGPRDPEARRRDVPRARRALALNVAYALVGSTILWAFRGLPHLGRRRCGWPGWATCSASPRSGRPGRRSSSSGVPFGGVEVVLSLLALVAIGDDRRSLARQADPTGVAAVRRSAPPCCSSRRPASRSRACCSRRCSAQRDCRACRRTTRGRSGCRRRRRSSSSAASTSRCSRRRRTVVPAARTDPRRCGLPRDGRRRRGHAARAVLVPRRSAPSARSPVSCIGTRLRGFSGRRSCSCSSCRGSASDCSRRRPTCSSTFSFVVAALLVALWLRDAQDWRLASAALLLAAAAVTKREGLLFAACLLVAALVVSGRADRGPGGGSAWRRRRGRGRRRPLAPLVCRRTESPAAPRRRAVRRRRSTAGCVSALGDVLYDNALWSVLPIVATIALAAAAVWGDRRLAVFLGSPCRSSSSAASGRRSGIAELPITANEAVNPIVRYTAVDRVPCRLSRRRSSWPRSGRSEDEP